MASAQSIPHLAPALGGPIRTDASHHSRVLTSSRKPSHSPSQGHLGWGTHHSMWSCQDGNAWGAPPPTNVIPIVIIPTQLGTGVRDLCVASEILSSGTHQTKEMAEGFVLFLSY